MIEVGSNRRNYSEKELTKMARIPTLMRNRWRGRLRLSAQAIAKEEDPIKKANYLRMFKAQKEKLIDWEKEVQSRKGKQL